MFATQPQQPTEVFAAGLRLFRATLPALLPLAAIISLPQTISASYVESLTPGPGVEDDPEQLALYVNQLFRIIPVLYFTMMLNFTAVALAQTRTARGQQTSMAGIIAEAMRLSLPLTLLALAYVALVSIGLLALVLPGIILAVNLALFIYTPIMEQRSPWSGLGRSHALVWSQHWWRTATVLSLTIMLGLLLSALLQMLAGGGNPDAMPGSQGEGSWLSTRTLVSWAVMTFFTPLSTAIMLAQYQDLLLREGAADSPEPPPPTPGSGGTMDA
jgi:hypothetical protein